MAPAEPRGQTGVGARSILARWLPGLALLLRYDPAWLRHDVVSGLVLTTMLVPVGIAYAAASGGPGIYGLYATIVPLLGASGRSWLLRERARVVFPVPPSGLKS